MGADFLDIELEVRDSKDLALLATAFGKKFQINYCGRISRGKYLLSGALARARATSSPEVVARALCGLVNALHPEARKIWTKAIDRVFDVGFDATTNRRSIVNLFSPTTVSAIGRLGARIAVSVYTHDLEKRRKKKLQPRRIKLQRSKRRTE